MKRLTDCFRFLPLSTNGRNYNEKCLDYEKKRGKSDLEALEQAINNPAFSARWTNRSVNMQW